MTKKKKSILTNWRGEEISVNEFVHKGISGSDYGRGELETLVVGAANQAAAFVRLVQILHDKNILSEEEIFYMVNGFPGESND